MKKASRVWMTVDEILNELGISRRTWQEWRCIGRTPKCYRLPNGSLRIKRNDFDCWMENLIDNMERAA